EALEERVARVMQGARERRVYAQVQGLEAIAVVGGIEHPGQRLRVRQRPGVGAEDGPDRLRRRLRRPRRVVHEEGGARAELRVDAPGQGVAVALQLRPSPLDDLGGLEGRLSDLLE